MTWTKKGGKGLWSEYVNEQTGETSIEEHQPKVIKTWCPNGKHDFRVVDMNKRLAVCSKCDQEINFIIGKHEVKDGKVTIS
jgi:hypothetical protein